MYNHLHDNFIEAVKSLNLKFPNKVIREKTGYSSGLISDYLNSKREVSEEFAREFCKAFNLKYEDLLLPAKRNLPQEEEYFDLPRAFTKKELEEMLGKGKKQETYDIEHEEITEDDKALLQRYKAVTGNLDEDVIKLMVLNHEVEIKKIKQDIIVLKNK